jgi:CxxC-x17-CxxC domain-containing protein
MKKSNRDNRSGGARGGKKFRGTDSEKGRFSSRGDKRGFGDRDSGRPSIMHRATCSECGKECELPFRPTGNKPVFCSNCFGNKAHSSRSGGRDYEHSSRSGGRDYEHSHRSGGRDYEKSHFQEKRMYSGICTECGNKCEVPFRPTGGKPLYCSNCFRKGDDTGGKNTEQFEILNAKLDTILKLLTPVVSTEVVREQKATRKAEVPEEQKATRKAEVPEEQKATRKIEVPKPKKVAKKPTKKTVSSKKTVKKKAVAKKKVAKKATKKKKS